MLEWDDTTFTVKRSTGEVLFQAATDLVYKSVEVGELYGAEPQICLSNDQHTLEIAVARKHAQAALSEIRRLVSTAAAVDPSFRATLAAGANTLRSRGLGCLGISVAGLLLGGGAITYGSLGSGTRDFVYFVLFVFALGLIIGASLLYTASKQSGLGR